MFSNNIILKVVTGIFSYFMVSNMVLACSTCSSQYTQEKLLAYYTITLLLMSLPFIVGGSIFLYVYKKHKARKN